jgi:uncharacterized protein (TIGR00730 family)
VNQEDPDKQSQAGAGPGELSGDQRASGARLESVAVYCGSSPGFDPGYAQGAAALGKVLAERGIRLVYGGGHVGLMGTVADAALAAGGQAHGVITRALQAKEIAHASLTSLEVVETMHERKAAMADKADGFVMLPGGFGTLDEFFEVVTWTQLGIHVKPCGVLDVGGFFAPLRAMLDTMTGAGFVRPGHRDMIAMDPDPVALLDQMAAWRPPHLPKWLGPGER